MNNDPNTIFALFVTIILFGYLFKRLGILKVEDSKSIINLILYFTLPAVVLKTFHQAKLSSAVWTVFLASLGFGILMTVPGIYFFRKNSNISHKGLLMSSCMGFNIGLFAYPFVEAFWGLKGLLNIAVFDLANAFVVFGISYIVAAVYSPQIQKVNYFFIIKKLLVFVPLQCYIVAIISIFLEINYPPIVLNFLEIIAKANSALVLLVIGMFLSFKIDRENLSNAIKVLGLRYIVGVLLGIVLFFSLPVAPEIRNTIALGLVLPVGMSAIPYSVMFGYDTKLSGALVNISNLISFVLMWVFISVL